MDKNLKFFTKKRYWTDLDFQIINSNNEILVKYYYLKPYRVIETADGKWTENYTATSYWEGLKDARDIISLENNSTIAKFRPNDSYFEILNHGIYKIKLIKTFFPMGGFVIVNSDNEIIVSFRRIKTLKSRIPFFGAFVREKAKVTIKEKFLTLKELLFVLMIGGLEYMTIYVDARNHVPGEWVPNYKES